MMNFQMNTSQVLKITALCQVFVQICNFAQICDEFNRYIDDSPLVFIPAPGFAYALLVFPTI